LRRRLWPQQQGGASCLCETRLNENSVLGRLRKGCGNSSRVNPSSIRRIGNKLDQALKT
jgi:hypothetical protein